MKTPRVRTVLLVVILAVALLPLVGLALLRLYENELIRRTEAELIAQGAVLEAVYRDRLLHHLGPEAAGTFGEPVAAEHRGGRTDDGSLPHVPAAIDVRKAAIGPAQPDPRPADRPAHPAASAAGREVEPLVRRAKGRTLAGIRLLDHRGVIVAASRGAVGGSLGHTDEFQRAMKGEVVRRLRVRTTSTRQPPLASFSRGTLTRVFVAVPVLDADRVLGVVMLSRTPMDVMKALYVHRGSLIFGAILLILAVVGVTALTTLTLSRPLRALATAATSVARGQATEIEPLPNPGTREMDQLSKALATMSRSLRERTQYMENVFRHLSHELKAPVAAIRGAVELMRDHLDGMSAEERAGFLDTLGESSERLEKLVTRLLDLARADVYRPAGGRVAPAVVATEVVERFSKKGAEIHLDARGLLNPVAMEPEIVDSILTLLIENAVTHGGDGQRIDVRVRKTRLEVLDKGPGVAEADRDKIFDPFFTTARERGGTGLGLSIVKSLVEAHGGRVELHASSKGAHFVVYFSPPQDPESA